MVYKVTQFRQNIYQILEKVLRTGVPVQIEKGGKYLFVSSQKKPSKLSQLKAHDYIVGDAEDFIHLDWSKELKLG